MQRATNLILILFVLFLTACGEKGSGDEGLSPKDDDNQEDALQSSIVNVKSIYGNDGAFAAIKEDGSVISWGHAMYGGDNRSVIDQLVNVVSVTGSIGGAFAALREDGNVVVWGNPEAGGDSTLVQKTLHNIKSITATRTAFAAITETGSVVTWGAGDAADSSSVQTQLNNVISIVSSHGAFTALTSDDKVISWGDADLGGDKTPVADQLTGIQKIVASAGAFAALKTDGRVLAWGGEIMGGDLSTSEDKLFDVIDIVGNRGVDQNDVGAFTALKSDGTVVPWGAMMMGGDVCHEPAGRRRCGSPDEIYNNVSDATSVYSSPRGFITQNANLNITSWVGGYEALGSDDAPLDITLWPGGGYYTFDEKIVSVTGTKNRTFLLTEGGNVFSSSDEGGHSIFVSDARQIVSTLGSVAVLKKNGDVVTWGDGILGGDSRDLSSLMTASDHLQGDHEFAILNDRGQVAIWGSEERTIDDSSIYYAFEDTTPIKAIAQGGGIFIKEDHGISLSYGLPGGGLFVSDSGLGFSDSNVALAYEGVSGFALVHLDGNVSVWGSSTLAIRDQLYDVKQLIPSEKGFSGIRHDGSVVSWGPTDLIVDIRDSLTSVESIHAAYSAFTALTTEGRVVTWKSHTTFSSARIGPAPDIINVVNVFANEGAFVALQEDGTAVTWGRPEFGSGYPSLKNVATITPTRYSPGRSTPSYGSPGGAFAALYVDGTVTAWGHEEFGGNSSPAQDELVNIVSVSATASAFAALTDDGHVIAWGNPQNGGNASTVQSLLIDVEEIYPSLTGFIARRKDGSLVSWGNTRSMNPL